MPAGFFELFFFKLQRRVDPAFQKRGQSAVAADTAAEDDDIIPVVRRAVFRRQIRADDGSDKHRAEIAGDIQDTSCRHIESRAQLCFRDDADPRADRNRNEPQKAEYDAQRIDRAVALMAQQPDIADRKQYGDHEHRRRDQQENLVADIEEDAQQRAEIAHPLIQPFVDDKQQQYADEHSDTDAGDHSVVEIARLPVFGEGDQQEDQHRQQDEHHGIQDDRIALKIHGVICDVQDLAQICHRQLTGELIGFRRHAVIRLIDRDIDFCIARLERVKTEHQLAVLHIMRVGHLDDPVMLKVSRRVRHDGVGGISIGIEGVITADRKVVDKREQYRGGDENIQADKQFFNSHLRHRHFCKVTWT